MAHTVFTLHYITSWLQPGVMFLTGRRLYLLTQTRCSGQGRERGGYTHTHTSSMRTRSHVQAPIGPAAPFILCHVSVMCVYDTMFGLCKLSTAGR